MERLRNRGQRLKYLWWWRWTAHGGQADKDRCGTVWGEGLINGISKLLVGLGSGRAYFNDADSNGFAIGDNVDLVVVFALMV